MEKTINEDLAAELNHLTETYPLHRDSKGYYVNEWHDWEGGAGSFVKTYLPDNLQQTAEMLNLTVCDSGLQVKEE